MSKDEYDKLAPIQCNGDDLGPVVNSVAKGPKAAKLGIALSILSCFHRR